MALDNICKVSTSMFRKKALMKCLKSIQIDLRKYGDATEWKKTFYFDSLSTFSKDRFDYD